MSFPNEVSHGAVALLVTLFALLSLIALCLFVLLIVCYRRDSSSNVIARKQTLEIQKVGPKIEPESTDSSSTDESLPTAPPKIVQIDDTKEEYTSVLMAGDSCFSSYDESDDEESLKRFGVAPRTSLRCSKLNLNHPLELDEVSLGRPLPQNLQLTVSGKLPNEDEESSIVINMKAAQAGLRGESSANAAEV